MAASAVPLSPPVPFGSISGIPAAAPIRFPMRISRRHLSPFGDCTFRCGLIPRSHSRIHFAGYAEVAVPECLRLSRPGLEFRGRSGRRSGVLAIAEVGVGSAGGNFGFFLYNWAEAVEGGGLNGLLVIVWNYGRTKRRIQAVPWLAGVIGIVTVVGILAPRFSFGRVFVATCCAITFVTILFGLLVDDGKLRLICDKFELVDVRTTEQLHTFSEAISKVSHDSRKFLASWLLSIIPPLAGKCERDNAGNLSLAGFCLIFEAGGVSISPSDKNCRARFSVLDCKPDVETIVTIICQSVIRFISMGTTTQLAAASIALLSRMKSGIQDLCMELQAPEAALLARQSELHSGVNQGKVEYPYSRPTPCFSSNFVCSKEADEPIHSKLVDCRGSDDGKEKIVPHFDDSNTFHKQRTSHLPLRMKLKEASKAPRFHESSTLSSAYLVEIRETPQVSPSTRRTRSIRAIAGDGTKIEKTLPSEVLKSVTRIGSTVESFGGIEKSSFKGDDSHLVDFHIFSQVSNSLVEKQSPFPEHLSRNKLAQFMEPQAIRYRSPDPWQNCTTDCTTRRNEQDALARGYWAAKSNPRWRNDYESPLLDIFLIVDENSKIEKAPQDGIWNGRVNAYGSVDFWGKNEGSIIKVNDLRGTLSKSKATGRGSNFESVDDLEDDKPQDQVRRSLEKENRQLLRRDLSNRIAGQQRDGKYQLGPSVREAIRDDKQKWRDADPALATHEYGRGGAARGVPQILRDDGNSEVTKNNSILNMGRRAGEEMSQPRRMTSTRGSLLNSPSVRGRVSPPRKIVTTIPSNGPSRAQHGEGSSKESMDNAGDVNEGTCTGSQRVWDLPLNSEGRVYRGPEVGARNRRVTPDSSLAYTRSQPELIEVNVALERSKEARTQKYQKYLNEAGALLEQGMHGLEGRVEVGVAEHMLYEAANLLEKASEIYPADLIAVGQWGNTLLAHGQLKLKLSQQLRNMLPSLKASSPSMKREGAIASRERESMELTLQQVCEECEDLLVDAGRKFRRALSLDKSDFRALYNWGLALCYRGQLISEEEDERAIQDADKVYLAAIDKFEAILGISQDYVAGALLNWGLAMQDRSRLRDMGDKERVPLLLQAKELFQDAVHLDPNNGESRGALAVCCAELKELQGFEALQRQDTMEKPNRNWWQRGG